MRIISGTLRGRRLAGPKGLDVRPTADPVKEALFNILADQVSGASFLDLFAGTGHVGIEALSRGARQATFVESNQAVARLLRANLEHCLLARQADVQVMPVLKFLARKPEPAYDLVFLDPPYHTQDAEQVLPFLGRDGIIRAGSLVVVEHFYKSSLDDRIGYLTLVKMYRYGDTCLSVYRSVHPPAQEKTPA